MVRAVIPGLLALSVLSPLNAPSQSTPPSAEAALPLPDPHALLLEVERNDKRMEALRKDYTYHVHLEQTELRKDGGVKKTLVTDAESLTVQGVRVDRTVARNGKPLSSEEQAKENERIDKVVAKAHERQAKATGKGEATDDRGDTILSAARILELGRFTNERRVEWNGRPTLVLDYAGDPNAKTHSQVENVMRDLVGEVWIDEADRVLVRGQGHFLDDFKVGGGLVADVRKDTNFQFEATRIANGVWLPATVNGQGSLRVLLFAGLQGRLSLKASDYRRFRTSAILMPGEAKIGANGEPGQAPVPEAPPPGGAQPASPR